MGVFYLLLTLQTYLAVLVHFCWSKSVPFPSFARDFLQCYPTWLILLLFSAAELLLAYPILEFES